MCFETRKVRPFKDLKNVQIEFTNNARSMNQLGQFFFSLAVNFSKYLHGIEEKHLSK